MNGREEQRDKQNERCVCVCVWVCGCVNLNVTLHSNICLSVHHQLQKRLLFFLAHSLFGFSHKYFLEVKMTNNKSMLIHIPCSIKLLQNAGQVVHTDKSSSHTGSMSDRAGGTTNILLAAEAASPSVSNRVRTLFGKKTEHV